MSKDKKDVICCPLMSAGKDIEVVCMQEKCAWYLKNYKICSVYMLAYNSAMEVQAKQQGK